MIHSYEDAIAFLYKAIDYEKLISYQYNTSTFSLDRMCRMLEHVENPHKAFPSVHITGTKGKGSTSIMIATLLEHVGLKVGLFTSPHLVELEERIQINRQKISRDDFAAVIGELLAYVQYLRETDPSASPTFFEMLTAAAMIYFKAKKVDIAVLEVGLGGRLDSTNVVTPLVSVITNVGFDHTAILGNTLSSIAYEKAGIIKEGIPVLSAVDNPEALSVIERTCKEKNARLRLLERDLWVENAEYVGRNGTRGLLCKIKTWRHTYENIFLPLIGLHQSRNCAMVLGALEILKERNFISPGDQTIREAFTQVRCPARIEIVGENPLVILDYAHTTDSMRSLRKAIQENFTFHKLIVILGFSQDKDVDNILKEIVTDADAIIVTRSKNPRAADPEELCQRIKNICGKEAIMANTTRDAVIHAKQIAAKEDVVCITGSAYVAGEAMQALDSRV